MESSRSASGKILQRASFAQFKMPADLVDVAKLHRFYRHRDPKDVRVRCVIPIAGDDVPEACHSKQS